MPPATLPLSLHDALPIFSNGEDTVQFAPTHYVDISSVEARKRASCYAHASQAPDKFYALQELVTRLRGIESGHKQAEGFIRDRKSTRLNFSHMSISYAVF